MSLVKAQPEVRKLKFVLPPDVKFGYHKNYYSDKMEISNDGLEARKIDPEIVYAKGVVYSERPVRGYVEFEVEIISYGTSWCGNLKLGIMLHKSQTSLEPRLVPRYTPETANHCVWCASKIHDHVTLMAETLYGGKTLDELKEGDRLGLLITSDGELHFLVNGEPQGRATYGIYRPGYDVYIAVDHYANCIATRITRANETNNSTSTARERDGGRIGCSS